MANRGAIVVCLILGLAWQTCGANVNCTITGAGRHANTLDTTCQNYTLCVYVSSNGTYVSYDYTCPTTSVFNPTTSLCTAASNYVCNVTITTTSVDAATTTPADTATTTAADAATTTPADTATTTLADTSTTTTAATTTTTITTTTTTTTPASTTFSCTSTGRYANPSDTTCKTYYLCVLTATGTFTQYEYTCPTSSVFSPLARLCTTSYTCS